MSETQNPTIRDLIDTIRAIWTNRHTIGYTGDWLPLLAIRDRIASYEGVQSTREDIDLALGSLLYLHEARLIPESNTKTLTEADWDAAIWIGGQWHHLVSFAK